MQAVKWISEIRAAGQYQNALAFVREDERVYRFDRYSQAAHDGDKVIIAPDAPANGPGRFVLVLKAGSPVSSGGDSPLMTKGDLHTFDSADTRLPVGADDEVLIADSGEPTGLRWGAPPGGSYSPPIPESDVSGLVSDLSDLASDISTEASARATADGLLTPKSRVLTGTSPIRIDGAASGDLSSDRIISINDASTSAKGAVQLATPSSDTTAGHVVQASDARLSDARTPTAHATSHKDGGGDEVGTASPAAAAIPKADGSGKLDSWVTANAAAATSSLRKLGTGATDACAGNDSRLSDARTPSAHETSHRSGGGDALSILNLAGYPGGTTQFLRSDGSFNVPDYSTGGADPLGKGFFSHNSLLPATMYKEEIYDYPATDFANLNSGTKSVSMSRARFTPGGTNSANWGWNLGGLKSKVLIVFSMMRARSNVMGLFITGTLPTAGQFEDGYVFNSEPGVPDFALLKRASSAYTSLGTEVKFTQDDTVKGPSVGMALYYDDATNRLICFVRSEGEWIPIIDVTDSSFTTMRYVGIHNDAGTGTGANQVQFSAVPMMIYYTT